jgi:hypothetical protein
MVVHGGIAVSLGSSDRSGAQTRKPMRASIKERGLHVDDDPSILRFVSHRLMKDGYDAISISR